MVSFDSDDRRLELELREPVLSRTQNFAAEERDPAQDFHCAVMDSDALAVSELEPSGFSDLDPRVDQRAHHERRRRDEHVAAVRRP